MSGHIYIEPDLIWICYRYCRAGRFKLGLNLKNKYNLLKYCGELKSKMSNMLLVVLLVTEFLQQSGVPVACACNVNCTFLSLASSYLFFLEICFRFLPTGTPLPWKLMMAEGHPHIAHTKGLSFVLLGMPSWNLFTLRPASVLLLKRIKSLQLVILDASVPCRLY